MPDIFLSSVPTFSKSAHPYIIHEEGLDEDTTGLISLFLCLSLHLTNVYLSLIYSFLYLMYIFISGTVGKAWHRHGKISLEQNRDTAGALRHSAQRQDRAETKWQELNHTVSFAVMAKRVRKYSQALDVNDSGISLWKSVM